MIRTHSGPGPRILPPTALCLVLGCNMGNPAFDGVDSGESVGGESSGEESSDGESGESSGSGDGDGDGDPGDGDPGDGDPGDGDGEPGDGDGEPGEERVVFITSLTTMGNIGGLEAADSLCAELAQEAGLDGEFKAWLSTAQLGPAARMTHFAGPYRLVSGELVANSWSDLSDGSLAHAIDRDETGNPAPYAFICEGNEVWSNTKPDGTPLAAKDCLGWSDATIENTSNTGRSTAVDASWSASTCEFVTCASPLPLYCFQQ